MDARTSDAKVLSAREAERYPAEWRRQAALLRRRLPLFALTALLVFSVAGAAILAIPQRYTATADVMIDPRRERVVDLTQVLPDLPADAAAVDTEVEVLKSRALAEAVTSRLRLDHDPEFNPGQSPSGWLARAAPGAQARNAVVGRVMARLKVARVGYTAVIAIGFSSRSPDKAALIANAFTTAYLQQQLDAKGLAAHRASDWLSARLGGLRTEVAAADHEVERYKAAHGLMTLTEGQGGTTTEQEISSLDAQLAATRGERAEAEARLSAAQTEIAAGGQGDDLGEVLNSALVQDLRKQRDEAAKQIAELQGRYGPRHPDLLKAERQREALDGQIQQEIARVVANLKVQAKVASGRSAAIATTLSEAKTALARSNGASVELKELERNLESVRTLYQSFLDRFKQTSAQDGMAQSDARLVSIARPSSAPTSPDRPLLLAIDLVAALGLGLLSIWIAEAREDGVYTVEDVEQRLNRPCLGLAPAVASLLDDPQAMPADLIVTQPLSIFTEAFRALRATLTSTRSAGPVRTIAVTSAVPGEGKTTTCMCLGRVMARAGTAVVVVDCDLRRRSMNRLLAEPPKGGLLDVLAGKIALDQALVADGDTGLVLLPLGDEHQADEEVLDSPAMDQVLEDLRRQFKTVILDTAPALLVAQTRTLACKVDVVLFVTRWRKTPATAAGRALKLLDGAGAHVAGVVLTQVDLRHAEACEYAYAADYYPFYRDETAAGAGRRALLPLGQRRKLRA